MGALLLVTVGVVLGATVFRSDIAQATGLAQSVTVSNTPQQAVPVREQNLDNGGNIKVHEQGTANVNVTNATLSVQPTPPVTDGGGGAFQFLVGNPPAAQAGTATTLSIHLDSSVQQLRFLYAGNIVASFLGPTTGHGPDIDLALNRPIQFDHIQCIGSPTTNDHCLVAWAGAEP